MRTTQQLSGYTEHRSIRCADRAGSRQTGIHSGTMSTLYLSLVNIHVLSSLLESYKTLGRVETDFGSFVGKGVELGSYSMLEPYCIYHLVKESLTIAFFNFFITKITFISLLLKMEHFVSSQMWHGAYILFNCN